jgi:hypothetical protein
MKVIFQAAFDFGEKVHIDGDKSITGQVVSFSFMEDSPRIEVAWWDSANNRSQFFHPRRLTSAE